MRKQGEGPHPELPSAGPSGLAKPGKKIAEPMTEADVHAVIDAFGRAAGDAKRLGFDGVEVHGAHGYIIDTFFWSGTNERTDQWGGDVAGRTRFAADILRACRAAIGPDFPLVLRFSQWKQQDFSARLAPTPGDLERFLAPLVDAGVDIFHCSNRRFWEPEFEGSDMNLAGWTKKITGKPTITVGSVGLNEDFIAGFRGVPAGNAGFENLIEMLERGDFDLVAVGRALLVDPQWTNKIRAGKLDELKPYTADALGTLS
jgi:2,4-dienoyl-CoA reductase-like NADH-dependent reductase (Old Yellow Enzyme family)